MSSVVSPLIFADSLLNSDFELNGAYFTDGSQLLLAAPRISARPDYATRPSPPSKEARWRSRMRCLIEDVLLVLRVPQLEHFVAGTSNAVQFIVQCDRGN